MTVTEISILAWAILGLIVGAILLRFGRRDENGRKIPIDRDPDMLRITMLKKIA